MCVCVCVCVYGYGPFNLWALLWSCQLGTQPFYGVLPTRRNCRAISGASFQPGAVGCAEEGHLSGSTLWTKWQKGAGVSKVPCIRLSLNPPCLSTVLDPCPPLLEPFWLSFPAKCQGEGAAVTALHGRGEMPWAELLLIQTGHQPPCSQRRHLSCHHGSCPDPSSTCGKICPLLVDCAFIRCLVSNSSALLIPPSAFHLPKICWHLLPADVTSPVLSVLVCLFSLYAFALISVGFGKEQIYVEPAVFSRKPL